MADTDRIDLGVCVRDDIDYHKIVIIGSLADAARCGNSVDYRDIGGLALDFHERGALILDGKVALAESRVCLDGYLACGACFCDNLSAAHRSEILILCGVSLADNGDLRVVHVSAGEVDLILELVRCGHSVPDAVDSLGVEFGDFRIPVDLLELCGHAELLANSLGKLGLEADELAVLHVVHGSEVSNSDDQLALICDVVPIGLIVLFAACKTECKHEGQDCEYKCNNSFFHGVFLRVV